MKGKVFPMKANPDLTLNIMAAKYFDVQKINFEGPDSKNPFSFKFYNPDEVIDGKKMRDHLRFACAYWHTMGNGMKDQFGDETALRPWDKDTKSLDNALRRVDVFFEFLDKCQLDFYCFHDRDIAPEGDSLAETDKNIDKVVDKLEAMQKATGKKLLWGTANMFGNPRFMQGASTSPSASVFVHCAGQVKKALEITKRLGGEGYVFWGGREGYTTLLNTNMKRELDHMAAFMHLAVDYKKKIGFKGPFYIEPKPKEPTTHQYDSDAAACLNFLRTYGLLEYFKLNIETNHATLANHTMEHELTVCIDNNALGSIDANDGTPNLGWDTDCFPTDLYLTTKVMLAVFRMGGFKTGGLNFDAHRRRESFEVDDLFLAHIAGMDAFARGLRIAAKIKKDGVIDKFVADRYASWDSGIGASIEKGRETFESLEKIALAQPDPLATLKSGRQELLESIFNSYIK
jgi:xylose isomerase